MKNPRKIRDYLDKIREAHTIYKVTDERGKALLIKRCEFIFVGLEKLGIDRAFSTLLLLEGKEFLDKEYPELKKKIDSLRITDDEIFGVFGVMPKGFKVLVKKKNDIVYNAQYIKVKVDQLKGL